MQRIVEDEVEIVESTTYGVSFIGLIQLTVAQLASPSIGTSRL